MDSSFNLLDEPWIPCMDLQGRRNVVGLREVLLQAHDLHEIDDASPLVTISLYRLLLAVLHRVFGPHSAEAGISLWKRRLWDGEALQHYLSAHHDRFDLFGPRPFYQSGSLDTTAAEPIALLAHELSSGNNATLFDHTHEDASLLVEAAQAARYLLAYHGFAFGGRITGESESGKAGPLIKGALVLIRGTTLFETLVLNLHQYDATHPFKCTGDDLPAWERASETVAQARYPTGYLDLLTWQSRRVRLIPERDSSGRLGVRFAVVRKGYWFPDNFYRYNSETMVSFRTNANKKATGSSDPYPPITIQEERAVWRDSHALFTLRESPTSGRHGPLMFEWLDQLVSTAEVEEDEPLGNELRAKRMVDVFGLCADQAKAILWRRERLPLHIDYLNNKELRLDLQEALILAEVVSRDLYSAIKEMAVSLGTADLARNLAPARLYWSYLEPHFWMFLDLTLTDRVGAAEQWRSFLRATARGALAEAVKGLDTSARLLKARAAAEHKLHKQLNSTLRTGQGVQLHQGDDE